MIHYLRTDLARRMGRQVPVDIVSGTSVGAINAAFMAATMEDPRGQCEQITSAWRALRLEELISMRPLDMLRTARMLFGGTLPTPPPGSFRYGGLLETGGLERFVVRTIPWRNIDSNLRGGHLSAISVSTNHVGTGRTIVFLSTAEPGPHADDRDPFVHHRSARIGPRHVLASAAIPTVFPAVKIGGDYFTDGGLRQNTPISPAIQLGAERILVVSLRPEAAPPDPMPCATGAPFPEPLFLAGKALNALLLDRTEYDLALMQRINLILEAGTAAYGADFEATLNRALVARQGAALRRVQSVHIRPSQDIGALAADFVNSGRLQVTGVVARRMIQRLASSERQESALLSYLLFDGRFAEQLIDLGRRDAARHADELAQLFDV